MIYQEILKNFLFSLPSDIQVALDELMEEEFEVGIPCQDSIDELSRQWNQNFVVIYNKEVGLNESSTYFVIKGECPVFCWFEEPFYVAQTLVSSLSPEYLKKAVRTSLKKQLKQVSFLKRKINLGGFG